MKPLTISLLLFCFAPLVIAMARPAGPAARQDQTTSIFGEPLIVNGHHITDLEIKSFLCYGKGNRAIEARQLGLLMDQERELREFEMRQELAPQFSGGSSWDELDAGQRESVDIEIASALAYMDVPAGKVEALLTKNDVEFREKYPTLDSDTETRRAYSSVRWYREQVAQTMSFDAMFYPGHPDNWPELSREAVIAGAPDVDLLEDYAKYYEIRRVKAEEEGTEIEPEHEMMMLVLRDYVIEALVSLVEIKSQIDGLPGDTLLTISGGGFEATLMTEDVYQEMAHVFNERDIQEAKRFLALQHVIREELVKLDALGDRQTFMDKLAEIREATDDSFFNQDFIALMGHQFPSTEAFLEHAYLLEGFKDHIKVEFERDANNGLPPELDAYFPTANVILGLGRCTAEVLLVSAFDFPGFEWKENGWIWARQRAFEVRAEIDNYIDQLAREESEKRAAVAEGKNWDASNKLPSFDEFWSNVLDLNSEFWDPPMPVVGRRPPANSLRNRGRFDGEEDTRNDFRRAIGESAYYNYLWDASITDTVFFELEAGTVGGPFLGPRGYYLAYLRSKTDPTHPLNRFSDRHYAMLVEDYTRMRFTEFAHDLLRKAEVQGL